MKIALSEIRLFLENRSLEFHEILHENTLGNKYFRAKFREILRSGFRVIGVFLRVQFSFNRNFLTYYACAAFNWVLLVTKKKLRIAGFFALLPFLTYLCNKRLKPSIHWVQL